MNKTIKILLTMIFVLLFVIFLLKNYQNDIEDIEEKIGAKVGQSELSMTDYYALNRMIEDNYKVYLLNGEYQKAYNMLSSAYWAYVPIDAYKEKMAKKDIEKIRIADIKRVTKTTYHAYANESGEDFTIILNDNNENPSILPESFLGYSKLNISKSNKKLKCTLKDCLINIDKTTFNCELYNNSNKDIKVNKGTLITNLDDKVENKLNIIIPSKQKIEIAISFDTYYAFPKELSLYRENGGKDYIEYKFEIKK